VWDSTKINNKPDINFKGHSPQSEVWAVAVASNGTTVVSGTNNGEILKWEADFTAGTGTQVGNPFDAGDLEVVGALTFRPNTSDTQFLSGHGAGMMLMWDANDPSKPPSEFSHENSHVVNSIAITSDGKTAASASLDMTVLVWDLDHGTHLDPLRHKDMVWRVAIRDDNKLASVSQDGTVRLWSLPGGESRKTFSVNNGSMGVAFVDSSTVVFTGDGTSPSVEFRDLKPWPWP